MGLASLAGYPIYLLTSPKGSMEQGACIYQKKKKEKQHFEEAGKKSTRFTPIILRIHFVGYRVVIGESKV